MHPPPTSGTPHTALGISHLLLGLLWLPLGLIIIYLLAVAPILVVTQHGPDGMPGVPISLFEAAPERVLLIGGLFIVLPALLWIASGICILRARARVFSLLVAAFSLLIFPLGTLIGLWSLIALRGKSGAAHDPRQRSGDGVRE